MGAREMKDQVHITGSRRADTNLCGSSNNDIESMEAKTPFRE